jgi:hypothetical protein
MLPNPVIASWNANTLLLSREIEDGVLAGESFLDIVDFGVKVRKAALPQVARSKSSHTLDANFVYLSFSLWQTLI